MSAVLGSVMVQVICCGHRPGFVWGSVMVRLDLGQLVGTVYGYALPRLCRKAAFQAVKPLKPLKVRITMSKQPMRSAQVAVIWH